ncbi:unnamed protein product [Anisakis simplex]|uniref:Chromo domain-containing protein n=1 Tax=Anisakis simplex TaxID=6269 RepID=A0A3P6PQF1_ANISI|nr:unnamed protein product [Anisakis simplex]
MRWKGFPDSENTWEPENNLDCPELIQAYELREKKMNLKRKRYENQLSNGFDRGLEPQEILGAVHSKDGSMDLLIKWKGCEEPDVVSASIVKERCPQLVIRHQSKLLYLLQASAIHKYGDIAYVCYSPPAIMLKLAKLKLESQLLSD